jgi:hypothetical protein
MEVSRLGGVTGMSDHPSEDARETPEEDCVNAREDSVAVEGERMMAATAGDVLLPGS